MEDNAWVGFDLDGTIAVYDGWHGIEHIGAPIVPMVNYIKYYLACGIKVRIFTARCQEGPKAVEAITKWCLEHIGVALPVTDKKDFDMVALFDDRAVAVEKNTGRVFLNMPPKAASIQYHNSMLNPDNPDYVGGSK